MLISPFPNNQGMYPHLRDVIDELSEHYTIDYFYKYERGLSLEDKFSFLKEDFYKLLYHLAKDIFGLLRRRVFEQYDTIIAIDNLPYVVTALIFQRTVVLWSHDFVSHDQPKSATLIYKLIAKLTKQRLVRDGKIIIQDKERLHAFLKSIECDEVDVEAFYLPVSLLPIKNSEDSRHNINSDKPVLMQIGGINAGGSRSDQLIKYYQNYTNKFSLFFHGFVTDEIYELIFNLENIPLISSCSVRPAQLSQIVRFCDIGFISYAGGDINSYYLSTASGQLAGFLKCGKPIIAIGETDLHGYLERNKIGISIKSFDDLVSAIQIVQQSYSYYSENCAKMFDDVYNLRNYTRRLLTYLK